MKKASVLLAMLLITSPVFASVGFKVNGSPVGEITDLNYPTGTTYTFDGSTLSVTGSTQTSGTIDGTVIGGTTPAAGTFTTLSATGNFAVNTNKFTVAASSGNTVVAGTLGVTGITTHTGGVVNSSTVTGPGSGFGIYNLRTRIAIASVNTGVTLLAAVTGRQYRIINLKVVAIGANVTSTTATGVALTGTQSASPVALYTVAKAQLTRSAINTFGTASTTVLADGASFVDNDANTAITFAAAGGTDLAGASNIDVDITYAIE